MQCVAVHNGDGSIVVKVTYATSFNTLPSFGNSGTVSQLKTLHGDKCIAGTSEVAEVLFTAGLYISLGGNLVAAQDIVEPSGVNPAIAACSTLAESVGRILTSSLNGQCDAPVFVLSSASRDCLFRLIGSYSSLLSL